MSQPIPHPGPPSQSDHAAPEPDGAVAESEASEAGGPEGDDNEGDGEDDEWIPHDAEDDDESYEVRTVPPWARTSGSQDQGSLGSEGTMDNPQ